MIPLPFYIVTESEFDTHDGNFEITATTKFGTFIGAGTQTRALAVFPTIDDATEFAHGKFLCGSATKIRTTTDAIAFLREITEKCNINYLLVDPDHSRSTKGALLITSAIEWLRSTASDN